METGLITKETKFKVEFGHTGDFPVTINMESVDDSSIVGLLPKDSRRFSLGK